MLSKQIKILRRADSYLLLTLVTSFIFFIIISLSCKGFDDSYTNANYLEKGFIDPPGSAQPKVFGGGSTATLIKKVLPEIWKK